MSQLLLQLVVAITDQLFGDDLSKQVKELTEANRVGKKVSTHTGKSTAKPDYLQAQFLCSWPWTPRMPELQEAFFGLVEKRPQTASDREEEEGGEVKVTQISNNVRLR